MEIIIRTRSTEIGFDTYIGVWVETRSRGFFWHWRSLPVFARNSPKTRDSAA